MTTTTPLSSSNPGGGLQRTRGPRWRDGGAEKRRKEMQRAARAELGNALKRRPLGWARKYRMEERLVARGKHREQSEPARLIGPMGVCGGSDVRLQERRGLEQRHLTGWGSCVSLDSAEK